MQSDEKVCPKCAETIKAQAVRCRFCGHEMSTGSSAFVDKLVGSKRTSSWLYGIGSVIGLVLLARMAGCGVSPPAATEPVTPTEMEAFNRATTSQPEARLVTIAELTRAYAANEAKAQQDYGNQWLAVSGRVKSVELDLTDDPVVILADGGQEISLAFDKNAGGKGTADLVKGAAATIACSEITEIMGDPRMRDCYVMPAEAVEAR